MQCLRKRRAPSSMWYKENTHQVIHNEKASEPKERVNCKVASGDHEEGITSGVPIRWKHVVAVHEIRLQSVEEGVA